MKERPPALEAATKALARRDRSAADLAAYLERRGVDGKDAHEAVERLRDAGYVNDARYAQSRAAALAERGYGDEAVRFELEQAGVPREHVAAALLALTPERERAVALLTAARTPLAGVRRLAAKGFSADSIDAATAAARLESGVE